MQAHTQSYSHIQSCAAEVDIATALKGTSITQLIQSVTDQRKMLKRMITKALLQCTHFLAQCHIAYTTNFKELFSLVESCGSEYLNESFGRNVYL